MLTEEEIAAQTAALEEATAKAAKLEEERDNYRKGLLAREEELKSFKKEKEEEEEKDDNDEKETEWDENSKRFQEETLSKTEKLAEEAAIKALERRNDKTAQQEFRENHPEITDEKWEQVVANYNPKSGKESQKGIMRDLERAYVVYKFDTGETIDPAEIARTNAELKNKEMHVSYGTSGTSGKFEEKKGGVTDGQKSIGERFGITAERLEKEDDSMSATIKIV